MRNSLAFVIILAFAPAVTHALVLTTPYDQGGAYNPVHVIVTPSAGTQNAQKQSNLQSAYGIAAYNSCRSACRGMSDLANPANEARCLVYVESCLMRMPQQTQTVPVQSGNTTSQPQGPQYSDLDRLIAQQRTSTRADMDAACQFLHGAGSYSYKDSRNIDQCGCSTGYAWNATKTSCVVQQQVSVSGSAGGGGGSAPAVVPTSPATKPTVSSTPAPKFYMNQEPDAGKQLVAADTGTKGPAKVEDKRAGIWSWLLSLFGL